MRKKFLKEVKPLPEDITKFESGIDVDSASDSMAKNRIRNFFGNFSEELKLRISLYHMEKPLQRFRFLT